MTRSPHVDPLRLDSLAEPERRTALAHLAGCGRCRSDLAAADPSRLFALLMLAEPPRYGLEQLTRRLDGELSGATPVSRPRERARLPLAAALLLAGLCGAYVLRGERPGGSLPAPVLPVPRIEAAVPAMDLELLSSPGEAQVHELVVGDTHLVMIFDDGLDL
jgi:hypothetical protein